MKEAILEQFPSQIREVLEAGSKTKMTAHPYEINRVYMRGTGQASVINMLVSEIAKDKCTVPVVVDKSLHLPAFVDCHTLILVSVDSSDEIDLLDLFPEMLNTKAKIVCISPPGKVAEMAQQSGIDLMMISEVMLSQKQHATYQIVSTLLLFYRIGLMDINTIRNVKSSIDVVKYSLDDVKKEAKNIALYLHEKPAIIIAPDNLESIAVAWHHQTIRMGNKWRGHYTFPQTDAIALLDWQARQQSIHTILLHNKDDHRGIARSFNKYRELLEKDDLSFLEVYSRGQSSIEKAIYLIHLGDWIFFYLMALHGKKV